MISALITPCSQLPWRNSMALRTWSGSSGGAALPPFHSRQSVVTESNLFSTKMWASFPKRTGWDVFLSGSGLARVSLKRWPARYTSAESRSAQGRRSCACAGTHAPGQWEADGLHGESDRLAVLSALRGHTVAQPLCCVIQCHSY